MDEATYNIAPQGLATSFAETSMPKEYASRYKNRFQNGSGDAEKRQGIVQLGNDLPEAPNADHQSELIKKDGTIVLFATGGGKIFTLNEDTGNWSIVHTFATLSSHIDSIAFKTRMIFYNGTEPNVWTEDGITFTQMQAIHEVGTATVSAGIGVSGATTSAAGLTDSTVTNWVSTNVTENDLLYNVTLKAYGVVTGVTSAHVTHTVIGSAGTGLGNPSGGSGWGWSVSADASAHDQSGGNQYEIIDLIELNILPTDDPEQFDNSTSNTIATSAANIDVSGVADWTKTDIRVGDFIRNTTRSALTQVTAVTTAGIGVHGITGQTNNDSIILLKNAMPLTEAAHVHYDRVYYIDARDKKKVRISGAQDAQDLTRDSASITTDSSFAVSTFDRQSFDYGGLQPTGDDLLGIASWQNYIAFIGKRNIYFYQGTTPVGENKDLTPVGLFPQGCVSKHGFANIGNELVWVSPNGIEGVRFGAAASELETETRSSQINKTLRGLIASTPEDEIRVFLYQKRSWMCFKIGSQMYIHNFAPVVVPGKLEEVILGSWHLFDGKFCQMSNYYTRIDGTLLCSGTKGKVAKFDQNTYDDLGDTISTDYQTGWLSMKSKNHSVNVKHGKYIKPLFEIGQNTDYEITVEAPYNAESTETINVSTSGASDPIGVGVIGVASIGGSPVINEKYSLEWRGERARFRFKNDNTLGPDIISDFTIYYNELGRE